MFRISCMSVWVGFLIFALVYVWELVGWRLDSSKAEVGDPGCCNAGVLQLGVCGVGWVMRVAGVASGTWLHSSSSCGCGWGEESTK